MKKHRFLFIMENKIIFKKNRKRDNKYVKNKI